MGALTPWDLSKVSSKWPATMLAVKRTERVIGRIRELTNSINTIKGIKRGGVPTGTKWASMLLGTVFQAITMCPNQRGRAKATQKVKCLEVVNT